MEKITYKEKDTLIETVYDPESQETMYACYKDGQVEYLNTFTTLTNKEIYPPSGSSKIIRSGVVLFPSCAEEYGSKNDLFKEIKEFIHHYIDISSQYENIATYYVMMAWIYDKFHEIPYLRALGDFSSGKSRFIKTIGAICYRPIFVSGATTTAPIFRLIDKYKGTLVIDEADFQSSDKSTDIVKILNEGYSKGSFVMRCKGDDHDPEPYEVFGPKIVATRGKFRDQALESRFIVEFMGKRKLREDIPLSLDHEFYEKAQGLRNKLLMWRFKNYASDNLKTHKTLNSNIHSRMNQIALPLLSLIDDEKTQQELMDFLAIYSAELKNDRGFTWEAIILQAIHKIEESGVTKMTVGAIADMIAEMEFKAENITARKVGSVLSNQLHLKTNRINQGYVLDTNSNREKIDVMYERYGVNK